MLTSEQAETIRGFIADRLVEIAELLPSVYRLTLVARHRGKESAAIVVSDDNLDDAVECIRYSQRNAAVVLGPVEPEREGKDAE